MGGLMEKWYLAAPETIQEVLLSLYGWRLRRLRYGGIHSRTLSELQRTQWEDSKRVRTRQLTALNAMIRHARKTVPLYRSWPDRAV